MPRRFPEYPEMRKCRLAWRLMGSWAGVTLLLPGAWYHWLGAQHDVPEAVHSRGRSRELLERPFDDGNSCARMRILLVLFQVGSKFLPCFFLLQISSWPIQLPLWFVPLGIKWCPSVAPCAKRRKLSCCLLWWTVSIFRLFGFSSIISVHIFCFLVGRAEWSAGPAKTGTLTEFAENWDVGHQRGRDKCKSGAPESSVEEDGPDEEGVRGNRAWENFVTRPSDAAKMPSHFYCRLCQKNVSVLTHGHHEVLRHFQGRRHFARDQRLRLETPGWRVLDFQGNPLTEDELERQRENVQKGPLVVRDREHPFAEDLISDEAAVIDPQLPVLMKVSCLVDGLKMGGSYGLIKKQWAQFVLTAGPVKREVACTLDEVLVGSVDFRNFFVLFLIHIVVLLLVNYLYRNAAPNFVTGCWVGEGSSFLWPWVRGAWRVTVGLHANVGEGHFASGRCRCCRPFCSWFNPRYFSARISCVCSGWFGVPCCDFWRVACAGWHVQGVFGKWVLAQAGGVSHFWSASPEAVFAEGVLFRLWVFGSLLNDGIFCQAIGGGRTSRLDDVPNESSPCHHHWGAVDAVSCWGPQQHPGSVASHRRLPQGDWSEDWRRQLSGKIDTVLFISLTFFHSFILPFSF